MTIAMRGSPAGGESPPNNQQDQQSTSTAAPPVTNPQQQQQQTPQQQSPQEEKSEPSENQPVQHDEGGSGGNPAATGAMEVPEDYEPDFPQAELTKLDEMINRPRWVVPVLPKGELEVLLEAAIELCKKGRCNTAIQCVFTSRLQG